jgi:beta-ribofuranosylaminobenzene 5'-phosphate synthase
MIRVSVPSRTSVSLLDSNTFSPGHPGGGNLGFAIDAWTTVQVAAALTRLGSDKVSGDPESVMLTLATLDSWRSLIKVPQRYQVKIEALPPRHIGLASSSALQAAIIIALNHFDHALRDPEELCAYHARNYVEITEGAVSKGFTTGLGVLIAQYGGFAMIDPCLKPIMNVSLPAWPVCVAIPKTRYAATTLSLEKEILLGRARELDRRDALLKQQIITEQLFPALERACLQDIGDVIFQLQSMGSKKAEIDSRPEGLILMIKKLRDLGAECVFMSSLGPAIVAIFQQQPSKMLEALRITGFEALHLGQLVPRSALITPTIEP